MNQSPCRMLRRCAATAALACLATAVAAQAPKWKSFSYPEVGFRASFPSAPQADSRSQPAATGPIEFHSYCSQVTETSLCVAVFVHGPEATGLGPEFFVERIKQGVLAGDKTTKISETPIELDGYKGVALEAENPLIHTSTRIFLVGDTVYQSMVTSPVAGNYTDTARFLDSFRLIPRTQK